MARPRVAYFYDSELPLYHYGAGHPMKPHRVRMAHSLIVSYNLYREMDCFRPVLVDHAELTRFHTDDYINFLRTISPDSMGDHLRELQRFNIGEDCTIADGLFEFCQLSASGSIGGADRLNAGEADIVINWGGGLHHAKKSEASGFCYVNDCVLGILELLKTHARVLYIDIDIHHGDGVEEAFYTTDRVMTFSLHKYGDYFPGSGHHLDTGYGAGANTSVNFPLRDGIDDDSYREIFRPLLHRINESFRPEAIVLQCGADSLSGDRLGSFNLSLKGHGDCVTAVRELGLPTLVLGGGGYTMRNVARCWAYETSLAVGVEVPDELPYNDFFEYYGPDFRLHINPSNMENLNDPRYLSTIKASLMETLSKIPAAPGVHINTGASGPSSIALPTLPSARGDSDGDDIRFPDARVRDEDVLKRAHRAEMYAGDGDVDEVAPHEGGASAAAGGAGGGLDATGPPPAKKARMTLWKDNPDSQIAQVERAAAAAAGGAGGGGAAAAGSGAGTSAPMALVDDEGSAGGDTAAGGGGDGGSA